MKSLFFRKNIFPIDIEEKINSLSYFDKATSSKKDDSKCSYFLIDGIWLQRWKNYIRDVNCARPESLTNTRLRCIHNKALINKKFRNIPSLIFPKVLDDDYGYEDAFPQQELILSAQWHSLLTFYHPLQFIHDVNDKEEVDNNNKNNIDEKVNNIGGESIIQVENIDDINESKQDIDTISEPFQIQLSYIDNTLTWNNVICHECIEKIENSNYSSRLDYHEGIIKVLVINSDNNYDENAVTTSSRRKLRTKNISISIIANSIDTVSLIKLKIYQEMKDEIFPMDQNLSYNGIALDNNQLTLRDYKVLVGDTIELKFQSNNNNNSDLSMSCHWDGDATGKRTLENGFTGKYHNLENYIFIN